MYLRLESATTMRRQLTWILVTAAMVFPSAIDAYQADKPTQPQRDSRQQDDPQRRKWWLNPDDRKELGLTDEQSNQIDKIFESTMPSQRAKWREFEQLEDDLQKMFKESTVDVAAFTQKVTQVEKMRAELATTRSTMLYRMRQVLTAQQRPKLDALLKARSEARRRQSDKSDHH
jgi:Spy/CpxP family protein refolding chaperone